MSSVKIEWSQRVNGRHPGLVETVELTPFIEACAAQRRLRILQHIPTEGIFMMPESVPVTPEPGDEFLAAVEEPAVEEPNESELLGLVQPKPRAPRKPKAEEE